MAVYTQVSAEQIAEFLTRYDVGQLRSAKGIAEGVENSNYLIETTRDRFILTLYEKRVDPADLPFFIGLLDHLADKGLPVPRMIADRKGTKIQQLADRTACLIEFLPGISVSHPTAQQAQSAGAALGQMHRAAADLSMERANALDRAGWHRLAEQCGIAALDSISDSLGALVQEELDYLDAHWPTDMARSAIHADLFPDNVLLIDDRVSGMIDFYFSCTDVRAYDVAVTHAAWCFDPDNNEFLPEISRALLAGYGESVALPENEKRALAILARGACLRFLLTRAYDWINTPADALVTRKDPAIFQERLHFYRSRPDIFVA